MPALLRSKRFGWAVIFALVTAMALISLRELADARVAEHARPFRLSMSVGAAFLDVGSGQSLMDLVERADVAMYEQKKARRAAGGVSLPPAAK